MKKTIFTAVICSLLVSSAYVGAAEKNPCKSDVQKLCQGVKKGEGRIWGCLKQHKEELSTECKEKIASKKEEGRKKQESCKADKDKFCSDVKRGEGRIWQCLKQHKSELSEACRAVAYHKDK